MLERGVTVGETFRVESTVGETCEVAVCVGGISVQAHIDSHATTISTVNAMIDSIALRVSITLPHHVDIVFKSEPWTLRYSNVAVLNLIRLLQN